MHRRVGRLPGYSITELMVVTAIIGLLIGATGIGLSAARRAARNSQRLSDTQLIAQVIEQAGAAAYGRYPLHSSVDPAIYTMCADAIYSSSNPNRLDISSFVKRDRGRRDNPDQLDNPVPLDPMPLDNTRNCAANGAQGGYAYHRWDGVASITNLAARLKSAYVLEVALEGEKPADDTLFKSPAEISARSFGTSSVPPASVSTANGSRHIYYIVGKYCPERCY
jgi:type II secretory pathway pseudopilin PulG